jgi:hypothetical protein
VALRRRRRSDDDHSHRHVNRRSIPVGHGPGRAAPRESRHAQVDHCWDASISSARLDATHAASHPRQRQLGEGRQHGDAQAMRSFRLRAQRPHTPVRVRSCARASQQRFARRVQHDPSSAAVEKTEAELLFQHTNLLADRAVGQVEHLSGGAQILELRDRSERRQRM